MYFIPSDLFQPPNPPRKGLPPPPPPPPGPPFEGVVVLPPVWLTTTRSPSRSPERTSVNCPLLNPVVIATGASLPLRSSSTTPRVPVTVLGVLEASEDRAE